jgi:hypothetical protein
MHSFSPAQQGEIRRFADLLGVDAFASADASYNFEFERLGTFTIQPAAHDRVVASLSRTVAFPSAAISEKCLALAGVDPLDGTILHAGRSADGAFIIAADLPGLGVSASDLDGVLARLARLFEDLE